MAYAATNAPNTGRILCNSVFNSNLPFDKDSARYVRVLAAELMGESISANAAFRTRVLGTAPLHDDGSFYVEVPADTPTGRGALFQDRLATPVGRPLAILHQCVRA